MNNPPRRSPRDTGASRSKSRPVGIAAVRAAQEALAGTGLALTVDANGAYEWSEHEPQLRALDDLTRTLRTPICSDETLRDARAARQIAELGGPSEKTRT